MPLKKTLKVSQGRRMLFILPGHYLVRSGLPLLSGLLLSKDKSDAENGVLTNRELIKEKFGKTKLIVLSACRTGVENYNRGEGLIGLSRTFMAAGVPVIVGSQWDVDSASTAKLMKKLHSYRRQKNISTNRALQLAQIDMLRSESKKKSLTILLGGFRSFWRLCRILSTPADID